MIAVARTDTSTVGRWWWTVDRWSLLALVLLMALGALMAMAASPAVADRFDVGAFYFARRQLLYLIPALAIMIATSLLPLAMVRRLALAGFVLSLIALVVTVVAGAEVNGARRWVAVAGLSLQPSEFLKPSFAVVTAWLLARNRLDPARRGEVVAYALCAVVVALLVLEPDFSMTAMVVSVWAAQLFLAGLSLRWIAGFAVAGVGGVFAGYALMPHVAARIDRFLDPASGDSFQVDTAREAFMNGGLFGRGPGEGTVKNILPDAHSDFVFAVAGEEFGLLFGLALVALFAFIVLRAFARALRDRSLFVLLAAGGIAIQFGLQAMFHMGVTLGLVPPTGMTLPFISYGGSSIIAVAYGMGMLLALTRRRADAEDMI